jgi:D-glycero-alpha-D-manno-heptose-7-phosphate kinase
LAYCGAPHVSKDVNSTWVKEFISGRQRRQWYEIVECSRRFITAIENGQYDQAQEAMRRETQLRVEMTPQVLDDVGSRLVDAAREIGCAARFTGAGGGGCIWALAPSNQREQLRHIWQEILDDTPRAQLLDSSVDITGVL